MLNTTEYKYQIVLFSNKKKLKTLCRAKTNETIYKKWKKFKKEKKPPYTIETIGKGRVKTNYELVLVFPNRKDAPKVYTTDDLGRTIEAKLENDDVRIKEIIPYWREERVHDYEQKKRITFYELIDFIISIKDFGQIFTLNNNLFVQVDDYVRLFGNKNLDDTQRLFDAVKYELRKRKIGNFMFVKDINTYQRKLLYDLLEKKGFDRAKLFRHYSY